MPNLGSVLKQEIARIARREMKSQISVTKRASAQHRKHIASLRRQIDMLERKIANLLSRPPAAEASTETEPEVRVRFAPKGLRSLRDRLGLSAERFGKLVGVSGQSVYNWEHRVTTPRASQLQVIASVRSLGKREALARLEAMDTSRPDGQTPQRKRAARREKG